MATNITTQDFKDKVFDYDTKKEWEFSGELPAVIDFWAEWCGPCRMLAPIFEELSQEFKGKVDFYKVDTEEEQELAAVFGIRSIPSILFIPKEGKPMMAAGALPIDAFRQIINDELLTEKTASADSEASA